MKTLAVLVTSLFATTALADSCFIVEDAYTPAAYRVMVYGSQPGFAYETHFVQALSVTQVRHSHLTAAVPNAAFSGMVMSFKEHPAWHGDGDIVAFGSQNGAYVELEIDDKLHEMVIWHKFITAGGDFHTHIAGDVRSCYTSEWSYSGGQGQEQAPIQGPVQGPFQGQR